MDNAEMRKRLTDLVKIKKEFDEFKIHVSEMFLHDGELSHYETGRNYANRLHLNTKVVAEFFNYFFEERFYKETGLKVDQSWNITAY